MVGIGGEGGWQLAKQSSKLSQHFLSIAQTAHTLCPHYFVHIPPMNPLHKGPGISSPVITRKTNNISIKQNLLRNEST